MILFISWKIWNERNVPVFKNKDAPPPLVLLKIKREVRLWVLVGTNRK
jgi:hypothetical protein